MSRVIVGVDPHTRSVTIEAIDDQATKVATGRFGTATRDYKAMLGYVRHQWPDHRWAIEGADGWADRWHSGCSPTGSPWSTCRRSWLRGCGSSTPAPRARPTPPMPTRSRPRAAYAEPAGAQLR
jgi:hypothetical protein